MERVSRVHTTISYKKTNKDKPQFNFSMVVAGFLILTTMLSTTIATPAYAKEAYADNTVSVSQTMDVSSSYELSQLKAMLKQGILDVEILTSIDNSLNTLMADLANGKVDTYSDEFRKIVSSTTVAYDKIDIDALTITNGSKEDAETLIESTKGFLESFQDELRFKDVKAGDWFCKEVQSAAAHGLIDGKGDNLFDPQGNLSVAEAIKLASCARASFNDELDGLEPDTSGTIHWVVPYMDYAVKMGIIDSSLSDAELNSYITRDGMAKIFAKALPDSQYKNVNDLSLIPDSNVPDYVKKLFKAGIMIGDEDNPTFRLNDNITRAETACIINRVLLPKQRQVVEKPVDLYPGNYPGTLPGANPDKDDTDDNAPVVGDREEFSEYALEMIDLINKERTSRGLPPAKLSWELCYAADIRAKELSEKFSHIRPNGLLASSVLAEHGLSHSCCSENIVKGANSAEIAMESWMGSERHKAAILAEPYTLIGIGKDGSRWVQLFGYEDPQNYTR